MVCHARAQSDPGTFVLFQLLANKALERTREG
jgi:hypothetical protein